MLIKKLEIEKTKTTFIISVLKVVYLVGLVKIPTFLLTKVFREENLFVKKIPSSANSTLTSMNLKVHNQYCHFCHLRSISYSPPTFGGNEEILNTIIGGQRFPIFLFLHPLSDWFLHLCLLVPCNVQLNEYETVPYFIQLSQNLTSDCLLISVYYPVFTSSCMM